MDTTIARPEYPRPDFTREGWQSLNGTWDFCFDDEDRIEAGGDFAAFPAATKITVPFCYQSAMSGIGSSEVHPVLWYRRTFDVDMADGRVLLHFGAVDYLAKVWLNGVFLGSHAGGHSGFHFDVTAQVREQGNELIVKAEDYEERDKPRGKQTWTGEKFGCWYTATSGIWQPVWLEYAGSAYFTQIKITPDVERLQALCEVFLSSPRPLRVRAVASFSIDGRKQEMTAETLVEDGYGQLVFAFPDHDIRQHYILWSPEEPNLIDVCCETLDLPVNDRVQTYFGMRQIEVINGRIWLNGANLFQRLVLDQGYWKESLLTPPSDKAIIADIRLTKEMGFNGVRKHQKIEDPRYYYWADRMGLLVWGEMPSAYCYNDNAVTRSADELAAFIRRDYNHPCIVAWVTINESWGVRQIVTSRQQQDYAKALYYLAKALDPTRLVSSNDGWEQLNDTDICAIHDYALFADNVDKYDDFDDFLTHAALHRPLYAQGHAHRGQPVLMTEYGGIAFEDKDETSWGYFGKVKTEEEFLARLGPVTAYLVQSGRFCGFCYTQLTDVMQETNGLLTAEREVKVDLQKLKALIDSGKTNK